LLVPFFYIPNLPEYGRRGGFEFGQRLSQADPMMLSARTRNSTTDMGDPFVRVFTSSAWYSLQRSATKGKVAAIIRDLIRVIYRWFRWDSELRHKSSYESSSSYWSALADFGSTEWSHSVLRRVMVANKVASFAARSRGRKF
jgi:hypothetical protein